MEVLPFTLRAKGITISALTGTGAGLFNSFVNPIGLDAVGWRWYIIFLVLIAIWFVVIFMTFPETQGLSLEEVSTVFEGPDARLPISRYLNPKSERDEYHVNA
ncbi:hypothetical protein DL98DRAFT_520481 [Cadophora sp. DSE1049]|nr:hypothetical protein DL98DRAFT_520481 [Cadophora sp. DSE1049]